MLEPSDEIIHQRLLGEQIVDEDFRRGAKGAAKRGEIERLEQRAVVGIFGDGRREVPIDVGEFAEIRAHVRDVFATLDDARSGAFERIETLDAQRLANAVPRVAGIDRFGQRELTDALQFDGRVCHRRHGVLRVGANVFPLASKRSKRRARRSRARLHARPRRHRERRRVPPKDRLHPR